LTKIKIIFTFVLLYSCTLAPPLFAQTTKNFNFRTSGATYCDGSGEVCVDDANTTYVNLTDTYPVTRNGITFGWTFSSNLDSRDRDNSIDARFAGFNFVNNASDIQIFRVDVTSGASIDLRLAAGDIAATQIQYVKVKDNVTAFITCAGVQTLSDEYMDAGCNVRSRAAWPGSNTLVTHTMGSTTLFVEIGCVACDANSTTLNHLSLVMTPVSSTIRRHSVNQ
jgi:hypothetical protein